MHSSKGKSLKCYYIFTENGPIKIELEVNKTQFKVDNKWVDKKSFIKQLKSFLDRIEEKK